MFVVSFSAKKLKTVSLCLVIASVVVAFGAVGVINYDKTKPEEAAFSKAASNSDERLDFITQFGWVVDKSAEEVCEVLIPAEFDDVYTNYNNIQLAQGLDLEPYAGVRVKRWTYIVRNYPGYDDTDYIRINLLVHNGEVIGGDVCSVELQGFMHGFKKE